jgi:hypothetical protein
MSEEPAKPFIPVCPYCGEDPCIPEMVNAKYGPLVARMFCCPNRACRKIFNVELIGEERPRVAVANQMPPVPIHP